MADRRRVKRHILVILAKLWLAAGIAVLVTGIGLAWKRDENRIPRPAVRAATGERERTSTAPPDMQKPRQTDFDKYQVAPDAPRYIFIPDIDVKAMVKQVGITPDNHIEAPRNIFDAGWFNQSARPGSTDAVLMAGHVSSWDSPGVFYQLKKLKPDNTIIIERGDGTRLHYAVVKKLNYPADNVDMEAALKPVNPGRPGLNLITCGGRIIKGTNEFDQRVVVFAEQW